MTRPGAFLSLSNVGIRPFSLSRIAIFVEQFAIDAVVAREKRGGAALSLDGDGQESARNVQVGVFGMTVFGLPAAGVLVARRAA